MARGRVAGSHLHGLDVHEPKITHDLLLLLRLFQSGPRLVQHKHLSIEETEAVRWRSTAVKIRELKLSRGIVYIEIKSLTSVSEVCISFIGEMWCERRNKVS